ncbi:MAG: PQQ-binding-like beta-propeller repeat protein [Myxococcota bacterium]
MRGLVWITLLGFVASGCDTAPVAPSEAFLAAREKAAPAEREWRVYHGDRAGRQWSPLDQVRRENVARLEPAWEYASAGGETPRGSQMQCNPLVVEGVLYGVSAELAAFALDAATGAELWTFLPDDAVSGTLAPTRGLVYWTDDEGDERILFGRGPALFALDARTGRPIADFGDGGAVDLRDGLAEERPDDFVVATTPGALYRDLLIIGHRVSEIANAAPGHVRAYDVRSGELRWIFHTIPRPGELGYESWPRDAWQRVGGANSWAGITVDEARGIAFVPTGSATYDFYGGDRVGDNLFANTLLALDAATGERRWHQQLVRHDVWDRDLPAPPDLVTIERDGKRIDAVAQITKSGHVFLFERETGEPLHPIEEVPVPGPALPGEVLAETQPLPVRPPPFARQRVTVDDLTERTPEARAAALAKLERSRPAVPFQPPSLEGTIIFPGMDGGGEWGGAAFDPEMGLLYVNANDVPYWLEMIETPDVSGATGIGRATYVTVCAMCHGLDAKGDGAGVPGLRGLYDRMGPLDVYRVVRDGRGRMPGTASFLPWYALPPLLWYLREPEDIAALPPASREGESERKLGLFLRYMNVGWGKFLDHEGFPGVKPPWGTLTAIDLAAGELVWQVPLGEIPELAEQGLTGTGAENYGGPVVTAGGLVFIAAAMDAKLRAFDKRDGTLLFEAPLPAAGFATPSVYEADGRQFVVIAAGGGKLGRPRGDRYVAFALPEETP